MLKVVGHEVAQDGVHGAGDRRSPRTWRRIATNAIPVSAPRVNDRRTNHDGERPRFTSRILPPYMRRPLETQ
jgi:hypothetical protein